MVSATCSSGAVTAEVFGRAAPSASLLAYLKPSNALGFLFVSSDVGLTALAFLLSSSQETLLWLAGQVVLATALVQWFVLLHEAGHNTLFRSRRLNNVTGQLASFFALIPFNSWKLVHGMHHHWTGWQDLDMTTATLVPRRLSWLERIVINICWRLWIPLFSVLYRINNFWNFPRLYRLFPEWQRRRKLLAGIVALALAYGITVYLVGWLELLRVAGLALLLTFIVQDLIILSQHTHVPLELSHGAMVRPFPPALQEVYTRSLRFPRWFSSWILLHLDAHELHHMYPRVPGYRLGKIGYSPVNEVHWWHWLMKAKRVPGVVLLFQNRRQSGYDI